MSGVGTQGSACLEGVDWLEWGFSGSSRGVLLGGVAVMAGSSSWPVTLLAVAAGFLCLCHLSFGVLAFVFTRSSCCFFPAFVACIKVYWLFVFVAFVACILVYWLVVIIVFSTSCAGLF